MHWSDWKKVKAFVPHLVEAFPKDGEEKACSIHKLRFFYRYQNTPPIELLTETAYVGDPKDVDVEEVRWKSIEGFPHAGCVKFFPLEDEREGSTSVELEFTYRMPLILVEFLGRHPIQSDVEALVQKSMDRFVQICEDRGT